MATKKLAPLERSIPLRAIPEEKLNKIILLDFTPWLSNILSLTDEVSADRLETALPAIKDQCIGMGFVEIRKMFELYADSRLDLKPIPNYFDRILLGKIVESYRRLKNQKPKKEEKAKLNWTPEHKSAISELVKTYEEGREEVETKRKLDIKEDYLRSMDAYKKQLTEIVTRWSDQELLKAIDDWKKDNRKKYYVEIFQNELDSR